MRRRTYSSNRLGVSGKHILVADSNGYLRYSNDYGKTWKVLESAGKNYWRSVAISIDGKYQTAVNTNTGYVYRSDDFGETWMKVTALGERVYKHVAMSSDGQIQVVVTNNGYFIRSYKYGESWNIRWMGDINIQSAAVSDDGTYITIVAVNLGIQRWDGSRWTSTGRSMELPWNDIAMSANGKYQTAVADNIAFRSEDYGASWTEILDLKDIRWNAASISADGKTQVVCCNPGQIYISTDYGNSWSIMQGSFKWDWISVVISADAKVIAATTLNEYIYISRNSGISLQPATSLGMAVWHKLTLNK